MHLATLYRRSLAFHWPTHLATTFGVAVAAAVLTGALLVGDSIRGSLRARALGRLGHVTHALMARSYFRETLAADVAGAAQPPADTCRLVQSFSCEVGFTMRSHARGSIG